jgi:DNA-binding GntR family transcriptional regulator
MEGLAFRQAAEKSSELAAERGATLIKAGRKAASSGQVSAMIAADMAFHDFIYELSDNPLVAPSMEMHWTYIQRVMGEVLMRDNKPRDIWDQHEALLEAVAGGKGATAERLARQHILEAADFMIERLQAEAAKP